MPASVACCAAHLLRPWLQGTAVLAAQELQAVYGLRVVRVPLTYGSRRKDHPPQGFWFSEGSLNHMLDLLTQKPRHQPVLIGTTSVTGSEKLRER